MAEWFETNQRLVARVAIAGLAIAIVVCLQAALFYSRFAPRLEAANAQVFDLVAETAESKLVREVGADFDALAAAVTNAADIERTPMAAWQDFLAHFGAAPTEAIDSLVADLPVITAGLSVDAAVTDRLAERLVRLRAMYVDSPGQLLDELRSPPFYLWPTANVLARRSGYRDAATFNRAIFLAQTGDIGTARVLLAGLNARVDDPAMLGRVYYLLARLQFQLFLETPEVEYYSQSLRYLRESLAADPEAELPRRLLDFLLSLSASATAPQSAEGRPETPSEGEGAAISAEKRVF